MRLQLSSLRTLAGATSVVVPLAIAVHLGSEALALGSAAFAPAFWLRHVYLLVPLALALWSFSDTVGLGRTHAEMIRRCALVRARLRVAGGGSAIVAFTLANIGFFGITQLLEGVPIAAGSATVTGLVAAVAGSLIAALVIFFWARSFAVIALGAVCARPRNVRTGARPRRRRAAPSRGASFTFSLFVPNRPPPALSLV
jgi:hypothetical protein